MTVATAPHTPDLDRLLATGPFSDALRHAISRRGLSLERIRHHLLRQGVSVSSAALSYWQSGRSRPVRRDSVLAVAHLERILDVPKDSLTDLLRPDLPPPVAMAGQWSASDEVDDALAAVDTRWDDRLTRISQHDLVRVAASGAVRSVVSRHVLRAETTGADRWVVIVDDGPEAADIRPLRNCSLGRVVVTPSSGLVVTELLFERPLTRGETTIIEHEVISQARPGPADSYERKFRLPVREYVLEIAFEQPPPANQCLRFTRTPDGHLSTRGVRLGSRNSVHAVAMDFGPGCLGFGWEQGP